MGVNYFEFYGKVKIDLTSDTVTPETLANGTTAHNAAGDLIVGVASMAGGSTAKITSGQVRIASDIDLTSQPFSVQHGLGASPDFFLLLSTDPLARWDLSAAVYLSSAIANTDKQCTVYRVVSKTAGAVKIDIDQNNSDITADKTAVTLRLQNRTELRAGMSYLWIAGRV